MDRCKNPIRLVRNKAEEAVLLVPPSPVDPSINCCLTYQIKGMCNRLCKRAWYHCSHTADQDYPLLCWSTSAVLLVLVTMEGVRNQ